jgi:hypothetical protein
MIRQRGSTPNFDRLGRARPTADVDNRRLVYAYTRTVTASPVLPVRAPVGDQSPAPLPAASVAAAGPAHERMAGTGNAFAGCSVLALAWERRNVAQVARSARVPGRRRSP